MSPKNPALWLYPLYSLCQSLDRMFGR